MRKIRTVVAALSLCGVMAVFAGCDPPAIETLPMRPVGGITEIAFAGEAGPRTVTLRNETTGGVTAEGSRFIGPGASHFRLFSSTCNRTIAAGATCEIAIRLEVAGIAQATVYIGTYGTGGARAVGGVRILP